MNNSVWTTEKINRASALWKQGQSASEIGRAVGASRNAVIGVATRNRDLFPERRTAESVDIIRTAPVMKAKLSKPVAPSPAKLGRPPKPPAPPVEPSVFENLLEGAAAKRDLDRFQLPGQEPVAFSDLSRGQCKFMLVAFDAVAGPDSACCGADVADAGPWCNQHQRVVYRARAAA